MIWVVLVLTAAAGCAGGFVNSLLTEEIKLPRRDDAANIYRPGVIGNIIVGGVAAIVFWGLYGRLSQFALLGPASAALPAAASLTVGELAGSLVTGLGGGRLLTAEVTRRALESQNNALEGTKRELADAVDKLATPGG